MSLLITIEHTVEEVNAILLALAKRPFEEVNDLIVKIRTSAVAQLGATPAVGATGATPAPEAAAETSAEVAPEATA